MTNRITAYFKSDIFSFQIDLAMFGFFCFLLAGFLMITLASPNMEYYNKSSTTDKEHFVLVMAIAIGAVLYGVISSAISLTKLFTRYKPKPN
jgi:uncharacterized membrane protein YvlD (DUF360 family)